MRALILIGAGGLAREVAAVLPASQDYKAIGMVDDDPALHGTDIAGVPVLGSIDAVRDHEDAELLVCTGSGSSRRRIVERLRAVGVDEDRYATVIAPDASVSSDSVIGRGSIVLSGAVLTAAVTIGRHGVLMPHAVCTHDNRLGEYVTLCAGVALGGYVVIGDGAYLGMNSSVRQNVSVGAGAVLGMGSVLLKDMPAEQVWVGNPAHNIESGESQV